MVGTPVAIGQTRTGRPPEPGPRGGPGGRTGRADRWWLQPSATFLALSAFVAYGTWAALRNGNYYADPLLSPFYSPCVVSSCSYVYGPILPSWWTYPALAVLVFPLSFRFTCYYYRKSYYRAFWRSPPACAVADARPRYTGESRFPLVLQNLHRFTWYIALVFAGILTWDAITAYRFPHGPGVSVGSLILSVNAVLIWLYTLSCHSCRHLCGGRVRDFSRAPRRHWVWKRLSVINAHHMVFAWLSLVWIAWADLYVWLVASGAIHDPRLL